MPPQSPRPETPQELFWKQDFGNEYISRNQDLAQLRIPFFQKILDHTGPLNSLCELGSNIGENLESWRSLLPEVRLAAVEINPQAFARLSRFANLEAFQGAIQDYEPGKTFDLVFSCGVLIHLNPQDLAQVYRKMFDFSHGFVLINEYFNPSPQEISYRGEKERLYKRDFAGEFLDLLGSEVEVVAYGFLWKRLEPGWDNTTWTLLQKKSGAKPC